MRVFVYFFLGFFLAILGIDAAQAKNLTISVNLTNQTMQVRTADGQVRHWLISSGKPGFRTPNGRYRPQVLKTYHYSRKYHGAMPHSIFFRGGFAIHGTSAVRALGRPASHGCIRLAPQNARELFGLVRQHGMNRTVIAIAGVAPGTQYAAKPAKKKKATKYFAEKKKKKYAVAQSGKFNSGKGQTAKSFAGDPVKSKAGGDPGSGTGAGFGHPLDSFGIYPVLLR